MADKVMEAKRQLIETGKQIAAKGLVIGPGGNTSLRVDGMMVISASGSSFESSDESDYVAIDIETGKQNDGGKRPSSEVLMHLECYRRRPDVNAIVHTHPTWSTSVASSGTKMPPMFPDYVVFVGKPATLDYVIPTTKLLADAVAEVIADHNVVLMSNHGVLAVAGDLKMALLRVELAEENARMLAIANSLGKPRSLTDAEVQAIYDLESEKYRQRLLKNEGCK